MRHKYRYISQRTDAMKLQIKISERQQRGIEKTRFPSFVFILVIQIIPMERKMTMQKPANGLVQTFHK